MIYILKKIIALSLVGLICSSSMHGQNATSGQQEAPAQESPASRPAPTQMSLLDDDWELQIGDRLVYEVLEERAEEPLLLSINGKGNLLVPLIGSIPAEGKTSKALAFEIKEALEHDFFHRATIVITQREEDRNRGRITVIGEVKRQGEQLIPADAPLTLSQAIMLSGGFTLLANQSKVSVVGAGSDEARVEIDLGAMLAEGNLSQDPVLRSGDAIIVPREDQANSQVYVLGAVNKPGLYSILGSKFTLSQVVLMAEGFTRFARQNKVRLVTTDDAGNKKETIVNVGSILDGGDRGEDPVIKAGDMVIVDEKMISFTG